jgi:hypothetical protein
VNFFREQAPKKSIAHLRVPGTSMFTKHEKSKSLADLGMGGSAYDTPFILEEGTFHSVDRHKVNPGVKKTTEKEIETMIPFLRDQFDSPRKVKALNEDR